MATRLWCRIDLRGRLVALRPRLGQPGFGLANGGHLRLIGVALEVEILLGEELLLEKQLAAVVFGLHPLQVGLIVIERRLHGLDIVVGGFEAGFGGGGSRLRRN